MNKNIQNLMNETIKYQKEIQREMKEINEKQFGAFHDGADIHSETQETDKEIEDDGMLHTKPSVTVCIDFDGTMVQHEYPYIGKEADGCVETLTRWVNDYNVGIILDTMRSGKELKAAVNWCKEHGIRLYGIGCDPTQKSWTKSHKAYAPFSIDDRNVGCPLVYGNSRRPYVDWEEICNIFEPILKSF